MTHRIVNLRPVTEMTAERVLGVLDQLEAVGLHVWVDGGWGVDALVGRQTRVHGDLDLGVLRPDLDAVVDALEGYEVTDARYVEVTVQLTHATEGHRIDLHPSTPVDGGGTEQIDFDGNRFHIPPPSEGRIDGRPVRCLPLSTQLRTHQGYELRPQDRHDIGLLRGLGSG